MIVVKVGGSLFDWPELRQRLGNFLAQLDAEPILLVPGGGATADAIRSLDRTHRLGEEASHWMAIQALSVNGRFLMELLPNARLLANFAYASGSDVFVLDALPFFLDDERRADHLPHTWSVTSDSLAVRAAALLKARELILLKSATWTGDDWVEAARVGFVDGYFAEALSQAPELRVCAFNLRDDLPVR